MFSTGMSAEDRCNDSNKEDTRTKYRKYKMRYWHNENADREKMNSYGD